MRETTSTASHSANAQSNPAGQTFNDSRLAGVSPNAQQYVHPLRVAQTFRGPFSSNGRDDSRIERCHADSCRSGARVGYADLKAPIRCRRVLCHGWRARDPHHEGHALGKRARLGGMEAPGGDERNEHEAANDAANNGARGICGEKMN